jgi:carboxymethylenebutenolidase
MRQDVIQLYDDFTHQRISRRDFMDRVTVMTGSTTAALAMIDVVAANPAAAALVAADDKRLKTTRIEVPNGPRAYLARPVESTGALPGVVIVHENRGLNAHIEDVARRMALEGFVALAPDFLSSAGGTPSEEDKAREMIGALSMDSVVIEARKAIACLAGQQGVNGKVGIMGFCWGGGVVGRVATAEPKLGAAVVYYGSPPPSDAVRNIKAPLLLHYAGLDDRINANVPGFQEALDKAGVRYELYTYAGANHAFNNDTSQERYSPEAAKQAWQRTVEFLKRELG